MALISAITTCKGRLAHLQQTLPTLMSLPDCEVVVVDYDCPQRARDWVRSKYPAARIVHVSDRPHYNAAEARNRGVAAATAPWLFMVDADVAVAPTFVAEIRPLLRPGIVLRPAPHRRGLGGTFVVAKCDLNAIGGYDEVFEGWGGEDVDALRRLEWAGRHAAAFPSELLAPASHSDEERGRYHVVSNPRVNLTINSLYRRMKEDMHALGVESSEEVRRTLYSQIRQDFLNTGGHLNLNVAFKRTIHGRSLTTTLRYSLTR